MAVTLTLAGPRITDIVASAANGKATAIIDDYLTAHRFDIVGKTDQEKADAMMSFLTKHLQETSDTIALRADLDAATQSHVPTRWEP